MIGDSLLSGSYGGGAFKKTTMSITKDSSRKHKHGPRGKQGSQQVPQLSRWVGPTSERTEILGLGWGHTVESLIPARAL